MYFNSKNNPLLFIAEVGSNHEGSFTEAKKIVKEACKSNADIIKIQTYTAENMVSKANDLERYKHFKKLELDISQYIEIAKICKKYKKKFSASIWDRDQIKPLNKFIDIYKVGSGDILNFEIIRKILLTKKPLVVSTGLSKIDEIKKLVKFIKKNSSYIKDKKLALLHCNTAYPTPINDVNLLEINKIKKTFKLTTGYSDHTIGDSSILAAYIMGAQIVEKHFSINPNKKTFRDHQISFDKSQVNNYLRVIKNISKMISLKNNKKTKSEIKQKSEKSFRRSIYAKSIIRKGQKFNSNNIISLRPKSYVCSSKFFELIKKKSKRNYVKGDPIRND